MFFRIGFTNLLVAFVLVLLTTTVNALPIVSNVNAAQRTDGSGMVDIYYDLSGGVGTITVTLEVSNDGGSTWTITPQTQYLSGDVGTVSNGTGKNIIWNMGADRPGVCWPDTRFKVVANDEGSLEEVTINLPGDVPLVVVQIPAGTFMMGRYAGEQDSNTSEDPQHSASIGQDFYIGKYEVTKRQWQALMGTTPWFEMLYVLNDLDSPAVFVPWDDVKLFIAALNTHITNTAQGSATMRLPTEAEWEYACRAGTTSRFPWGDDLSYTQISEYAWWNEIEQCAHVVGLKLPNVFGLYDMIGNVWEWCEDDWHENYTGASTDGSAWVDSPRGSSRLLRGGSWRSPGYGCRSAFRSDEYHRPDGPYDGIGFRVAATLHPNEITINLPGDVPLVLVQIPAGTFLMGRYAGEQDSLSDEDPQHSVTISQDFYMGKYELTKRQWQAVMGTTPWSGQDYVLNDLDSPAVYVSWNDAQSFITVLNTYITNTSQGSATFRLPTETEWEYACRTGTTTRFYWGDDPSYTLINDYTWWYGNAWDVNEHYAHVVGLKLPNAFGLYDIIGNVWEWCEDDWHGSYTGAPTNGSVWVDSPRGSYRLLRGGSWSRGDSDCRSARRNNLGSDFTNDDLGLRVARTP